MDRDRPALSPPRRDHGAHRRRTIAAWVAAAAVPVVFLAVFFAYHVLWPAGLSGRFEWPAAVIGIAAAIALIRYKVGVIPVVLVSGLCGLALSFVPHVVTS